MLVAPRLSTTIDKVISLYRKDTCTVRAVYCTVETARNAATGGPKVHQGLEICSWNLAADHQWRSQLQYRFSLFGRGTRL